MTKMQWWLSESNHQVMMVIIAKLFPSQKEIVLEKYTEGHPNPRPGTTHTRAYFAVIHKPVCRQQIRIKKNPGSNRTTFTVAPEEPLVLESELLFLHPANPVNGERDIRIEVSGLQKWAKNVWRL